MSEDFYHSAELRWFLTGHAPWDEFLRWFRLHDQLPLRMEGEDAPLTSGEPFVRQERERVDDYLQLPNCDTAGIKQRQGRLEVKTLAAWPRPFSLGSVIGRTDQWVKWALDPSDVLAPQLAVELGQSASWRPVTKRRCTQKLSFDSGRPVAVAPDCFPDTGCNVELTLINVKANVEAWITFGFEAFGPPGRVAALLDEGVRHFFATFGPPPVRLDGRDSFSYPAWLAMLR